MTVAEKGWDRGCANKKYISFLYKSSFGDKKRKNHPRRTCRRFFVNFWQIASAPRNVSSKKGKYIQSPHRPALMNLWSSLCKSFFGVMEKVYHAVCRD
jgi:hypothetical protein